jgi:NADPH-dependent 2,4-dienoyl-CoA reductase/sulfur reductase-like enzyme
VCHVRKSVQRILKKQGLEFKLNTKVVNAVKKDSEIQVTIEPAKGGSQQQLECDTLLVCIGRKPYTSDIGLEGLNIIVDKRGTIPVNATFQTSIPKLADLFIMLTSFPSLSSLLFSFSPCSLSLLLPSLPCSLFPSPPLLSL